MAHPGRDFAVGLVLLLVCAGPATNMAGDAEARVINRQVEFLEVRPVLLRAPVVLCADLEAVVPGVLGLLTGAPDDVVELLVAPGLPPAAGVDANEACAQDACCVEMSQGVAVVLLAHVRIVVPYVGAIDA